MIVVAEENNDNSGSKSESLLEYEGGNDSKYADDDKNGDKIQKQTKSSKCVPLAGPCSKNLDTSQNLNRAKNLLGKVNDTFAFVSSRH